VIEPIVCNVVGTSTLLLWLLLLRHHCLVIMVAGAVGRGYVGGCDGKGHATW
jgi:hypothetical protein